MSVPNYTRFLSECITSGPDQQYGLRESDLYGVYLSWCLLNAEEPCSDAALWTAMNQQGHHGPHRSGGQRVWPGLSMTGPAAVDYIMSSQPTLL